MPDQSDDSLSSQVNHLLCALDSLIATADARADTHAAFIASIDDPDARASARNLLHYLALRDRDICELQDSLARLGLSSLGRVEAHVMPSLHVLRQSLARTMCFSDTWSNEASKGIQAGRDRLQRNARRLLGSLEGTRAVSIMVTLSTEAAEDYDLVRDMVAAGMDLARINCAHDSVAEWTAMARNVRKAALENQRAIRIAFDLAGPKLRTGEMQPGPEVVHWGVARNDLGHVAQLARIALRKPDASPSTVGSSAGRLDAQLPVDAELIDHLEIGNRVVVQDSRERVCVLKVVDHQRDFVVCETDHSAWVTSGATIRVDGDDAIYHVGKLPALEQSIVLKAGDHLYLTRSQEPGAAAQHNAEGTTIAAARIPCTLPEVFRDVRVGEPISLNDGKIDGVIRAVNEDDLLVEITRAKPSGSRLRAGKSINLPESMLTLPGLTSKDRADLQAVLPLADIISMSFLNCPEDVEMLQGALALHGRSDVGIILKIETRRAFDQLAEILLAAMRSPSFGVMIARGDLAVELGWNRMAEVQEEILWFAEAAHAPVIWATQVLEQLVHKGQPSRAEITDAAMSERAECVMLNKGPHIIAAIRVLDDILRRMQRHQRKKTPLLHNLNAAQPKASH